MYNELGISEKTLKLVNEAEKDCYELFKKIDKVYLIGNTVAM